MKLLLYKGTRPGIAGIGNWLVRLRTKSKYSHCELLFEESDGVYVASKMPDLSLAPDEKGAVWCYSATASDRMPKWSEERKRRAGKIGGTRFKRITVNPDHWDVVDVPYANMEKVINFCVEQEGKAYDWRHIYSFFSVVLVGVIINFFINQGADHWTCAEVCGAGLNFYLPEIFDPKTLGAVAQTALAVWLYAQIKNEQAASP